MSTTGALPRAIPIVFAAVDGPVDGRLCTAMAPLTFPIAEVMALGLLTLRGNSEDMVEKPRGYSPANLWRSGQLRGKTPQEAGPALLEYGSNALAQYLPVTSNRSRNTPADKANGNCGTACQHWAGN
jgi:hypothetical protein